MVKFFTVRWGVCALFVLALCRVTPVFAQIQPKDSLTVKVPIQPYQTPNLLARKGIFDPTPPGVVTTIEYDAATSQYVMVQKIGNLLYGPPQYLTFQEYLQLKESIDKRNYFKQLSDSYAYQSQQPGFIPPIQVKSQSFAQIFGSNVIDIRPQGTAEMIFDGQVNSNQNPLFNTTQRNQFNFNFDQRIQMKPGGEYWR